MKARLPRLRCIVPSLLWLAVAWGTAGVVVVRADPGPPAPQAVTFEIMRGHAVVDGTISAGEWNTANWIPMDKVYHGSPDDLSGAYWAALWDPDENVLFVAVTGIDADHILRAYGGWDQQDGIELYVNARNDDTSGYEDMSARKFDYAQQYAIGYDATLGSLWHHLGGGNPMPPGVLPASAFGVVTNRLTYEFKIRPFDYLDYDVPASSTEIQLQPGITIGLDMVMNSRTSVGGFGMLCENQIGGKYSDAGAMRDYTLVGIPEGAVVIVRTTLMEP